MARWTGSRVTADRAYWAARILEAINRGRPLLCPFCDAPVLLTQQWDIEHGHKIDEGGPLGRHNQTPAHRGRRDCRAGGNRADGARYGNTKRTRARKRLR